MKLSNKQLQQLSEFSGLSVEDINLDDWRILPIDKADGAVEEEILQSIFAFNPDFLANYINLDVESIAHVQELYENANPILEQLIGDKLHKLVQDAVAFDGRGHFLSHYDGQEYELDGNLVAYRLN